ncbi:hypothetical protein [Kibdelosporangium aridum]|uniref:hypothetical protein n=1 Tax=Kibdelosporangium aridum TaxID=2030 RepID=UPI000F7676D2|nr:hypothetical protein [Kibdelosporangium aridum]
MEKRRSARLFDEGVFVPVEDRDRWLADGFRMLGASAYQARPSGKHVSAFEYSAHDIESDTFLEVLFERSNTAQCWLHGYQDNNELIAWRNAFKSASLDLATPLQEFTWHALIGLSRIKDMTPLMNARLPADISIESFEFEVSPHRLIEYATNPLDPSSSALMISWPVHLKGVSPGRDWWEACKSASRNIRLICALLSVAYRSAFQTWVPRVLPGQLIEGFDFQFPVTQEAIEKVHGNEKYEKPGTLPSVPWLDDAMRTLNEDLDLADTLIAFHESLILSAAHPSVAVVLLVAAIESIGARHVELKHCSCCEKCEAETGYADRFRKMLREVLHSSEARKVSSAYENRSATAHAGKLFGHDRSLGLDRSSDIFSTDPERDFSHELVFSLTKACTRLLVLELGGPRTWNRSKEDTPGGVIAASVLLRDMTI